MTTTLKTAAPTSLRTDRMMHIWWAAAAISAAGDVAFVIALTWTAVSLLSPGWAGLIVTIGTLPQALLTIPGGVLADRTDTRRLMLRGELARIALLVIAATAWAAGAPRVVVLASIALAFGCVSGLTGPAATTLVRQLVPTADLGRAIGISQVTLRLARLGGAPLGALVVAHSGFGLALVINAGSFTATALALTLVIRTRYPLPRDASRPSMLASIRASAAYLRTDRTVRQFVLGLSSLNVFVTPVVGVGVAIRVAHAGWSASWLGYAEAALAAGAIVGGLVSIRWQGDQVARRAFGTLVLQGIGIALVGVPSIPVMVGAMALIGLTAGSASAWLGVTMQRVVRPDRLGQVASVAQLGDLVIGPVVTPLFAAAAGAISVLAATTVAGVAMAVLCLCFALSGALRNA